MRNTALTVILFSLIFYCCSNDVEPRTSSQEQEEFSAFIQTFEEKGVQLEQSYDGLYYYFDSLGNTSYPVAVGDSVITQYILYNIASGYTIDGTGSENTFNFVYKGHDDTGLIKGFNYSIGLSRLHSLGNFIFTSDLGYGSTGYGYIEPYTSLYFQIKIVDIYRNGISLSEQEQITDSLSSR
ncbi:MAG: FKBP-type peptidyl-prolyl cis-trans isomerase [Bacteroidales bacterium]